jgi:predicted phosphoadenosine phosphosulfate sulfurtransferase
MVFLQVRISKILTNNQYQRINIFLSYFQYKNGDSENIEKNTLHIDTRVQIPSTKIMCSIDILKAVAEGESKKE